MDESPVYPWQRQAWRQLTGLAEQDRLPHALLLQGPAALGKLDFAMAFAGYLLCQQATGASCGQCTGCKLSNAGSHPDRYLLTPEEDRKQIVVDQVRDLLHWVNQTPSLGGRKTAVIAPADAMNLSAANALLKCLEEPAGDTVLMLVTANPAALLPTITSRCQVVKFPLPAKADALEFLAQQKPADQGGEASQLALLLDLADGAPLKVLEFDDDYLATRQAIGKGLCAVLQGTRSPLDLAETLAKGELASQLELLYYMTAEAIAYRQCEDVSFLKNKDLEKEITTMSKLLTAEGLAALLARILSARHILAEGFNANPAMLFEWLLLGKEVELSL